MSKLHQGRDIGNSSFPDRYLVRPNFDMLSKFKMRKPTGISRNHVRSLIQNYETCLYNRHNLLVFSFTVELQSMTKRILTLTTFAIF